MPMRQFLNRVATAPGPSPLTYGVLAFSLGAALCVQSLTGVWLHASASECLIPAVIFAGVAYLDTRSMRGQHILAAPAFLATLLAHALCVAALSYSVQALALPLRDNLFIAADHALGFDWLAFQKKVIEWPWLIVVLGLCYDTFFLQVVFTPLALIALGVVSRADRFVSAFMLCGTVMVAVSAVLPAAGAAGLVGPDAALLLFHGATPLPDLLALRDGTLRAITVAEVGPIISFPSLHCSVAYLTTAAFWPVLRLRWAIAALNAAMTISAVTHGAHYICDCLAGLLIAAMSFHVTGWLGPWSRAALARACGGSAQPVETTATLAT